MAATRARKTKRSAGLLPYRIRAGQLEVLIAHMGGPHWAKKDEGAWSVVKGEYDHTEEPYSAARREFEEETGVTAPQGNAIELGEITQASGKLVTAWAIECDLDPQRMESNTFTMEWPRGSGELREFPEIDRAAWLDAAAARRKLVKGQGQFIDVLERRVHAGRREGR